MARGAATVNGMPLGSGDGAAANKEDLLKLVASDDTEILLFDLP